MYCWRTLPSLRNVELRQYLANRASQARASKIFAYSGAFIYLLPYTCSVLLFTLWHLGKCEITSRNNVALHSQKSPNHFHISFIGIVSLRGPRAPLLSAIKFENDTAVPRCFSNLSFSNLCIYCALLYCRWHYSARAKDSSIHFQNLRSHLCFLTQFI